MNSVGFALPALLVIDVYGAVFWVGNKYVNLFVL